MLFVKAMTAGFHVFIGVTCLPSNYLGMGVNFGFATFWILMVFKDAISTLDMGRQITPNQSRSRFP